MVISLSFRLLKVLHPQARTGLKTALVSETAAVLQTEKTHLRTVIKTQGLQTYTLTISSPEVSNTRVFHLKKQLPECPQPFVETRQATLLSDTGMSRHDARVGVCSHQEVNNELIYISSIMLALHVRWC